MGLLEKIENHANDCLKKTIDSKNIVQKLFRAHAYKIVLTGAAAFGTIFGVWSASEKAYIARNNAAYVERAVQTRQEQLNQEYENVACLKEELSSLQEETKEAQNQALQAQRDAGLEKSRLERKERELERKIKDETDDLEREKNCLENDKFWVERREKTVEERDSVLTSILDARKEALDRESKELDEREKLLEEADKRLLETAQDRAGTSLLFVQRFDVNRNYLLDAVDSEISAQFLGNISIVSPEYISSVRIICSPEVLKKLSRYGLQGQIVSVRDRWVLACEKDQIKRIIAGISRDTLYDFQVNPKGKKGIEQILANKKTADYQPVQIGVPELCAGSGFILGDGYIATAHHVLECLKEFVVTLPDGKQIISNQDSVIAYSKEYDLAVLRLDFQGYSPVALQDTLLIGEAVYLTRSDHSKNLQKGKNLNGYLYALDSIIFDSLISDQENLPDVHGTDRYKIAINATYGDSGSAIINKKGEIVGVASSIQRGVHGAVCVIRAKYLRKLLEFYVRNSDK